MEAVFGPLTGVVIFNIATAWPLWRIFRRAGLPPWWSLIAFAPLVGMVAATALLFHVRWPNLPRRAAAVPSPRKARRETGAARRGGE